MGEYLIEKGRRAGRKCQMGEKGSDGGESVRWGRKGQMGEKVSDGESEEGIAKEVIENGSQLK